MNSYTLTPKILENITAIERLYGQLESLHLPTELQLNLERNNLVQSSYVSNSIEGNPLSLPEVTNLLLGDRMPANRSEKEVKNYFDILRSLDKRAKESFTIREILQIHKDLIEGVESEIAGRFRNRRVVVGKRIIRDGKLTIKVKHEPPHHSRKHIEQAVWHLLDWVETAEVLPIVKISLFHHQYVYIHPFTDGNGRTVRLLTALLFLKAGYEINKYFVLDDYYDIDRQGYSDALHSADGGDSTKWLEYFTEGIKYSLQSALAKGKSALLTIKASNRPTNREKEVLELFAVQDSEIATADVAKAFGISRQQAQNLLAALVDRGLVKKYGLTKASYYKLA
ncbi:MAG: Fic family protein [Candidatus Nomurabacteria bacterium]|jgi:Fic family protein|nr:Fic family protein [Candidatus Nomurabacteria bacterium]